MFYFLVFGPWDRVLGRDMPCFGYGLCPSPTKILGMYSPSKYWEIVNFKR